MDLWQAFKDSPIWVKVDLAVVHLAAVYTALTVFVPGIRWCGMTLARWCRRLREHVIWVRQRPSIELVEGPSAIEVRRTSEESVVWCSRFKVRARSRDAAYPTHFSFRNAKLSLLQGRGARMKTTDLAVDYAKLPASVYLEPIGREGSVWEGIVNVQAILVNQEVPWAVNLKRPHRWRVYNISAQVHPLSLRYLKHFGGSRNGL